MLGLEFITVFGVFFENVGCYNLQIWKRDSQFDDKIFFNEPYQINIPLHALSVTSCGRMCKNGRAIALSYLDDGCYCYKNWTDEQSFTTLEGAQYYFLSDDYYFQSDERNCKGHNYLFLSDISVCYKDYVDTKSWKEANAKCGLDGGHLLVLDTVEKLSKFQNIIPENVYYWVGLEDMNQDGVWTWTNNESKEFNQSLWFQDEPNGNDEFCGMVQYLTSDPRVGIFDVICDESLRFLCEI